jgi:hypothetical protein
MFTKVPVFIKGVWMHVDVPSYFQGAMQLSYATTWVLARTKELNEQQSRIVAEAYVYQRMNPGIVHNDTVQELLKKIM